jgi:hypothetical protein
MIQKLTVHSPPIEVRKGHRPFNLRNGHTNSISEIVQVRSALPSATLSWTKAARSLSLLIVDFVRSLVNGTAVFRHSPRCTERP